MVNWWWVVAIRPSDLETCVKNFEPGSISREEAARISLSTFGLGDKCKWNAFDAKDKKSFLDSIAAWMKEIAMTDGYIKEFRGTLLSAISEVQSEPNGLKKTYKATS